MNPEDMDVATRKDFIAKKIRILFNMLHTEGLQHSHRLQLSDELTEYLDMDDGDIGTLTEDEDDSDEDSSTPGDINEDVHEFENDTDSVIVTVAADDRVHEDALANEVVHPIPEKEMDKIRNFMCRCTKRRKENQPTKASCLEKLNPDDIYDRRQQMLMLSADMRDMVIFGHYDTHVRRTELTSDNKKTPTKRKAAWTGYYIGDVNICRSSYMFMHW